MYKRFFWGMTVASCLGGLPAPGAEGWIVQDGQPRAEIVVRADAPRLTKRAAVELHDYVKKISGAELPLVTNATASVPVQLYVGRSAGTETLGIADADLAHGAYRMVSGPDWMVLIGQDADFEPWALCGRHNGDIPRAQQAWDDVTGAAWDNPMTRAFRRFNKKTQTWSHDRGGSLNAVCGFLRSLGVRWYMPGELGEVVPEQVSIRLPDVNRTVVPDFALRHWAGAYFLYAPDDLWWESRLGMTSETDVLGVHGKHTHGLTLVHGHAAMRASHPERYALVRGTRDTATRGTGHACFSSRELEREAVEFTRAMFDRLDLPAVSLWPQDGLRPCGCPSCAPLSASEQVWGFTERVAREVLKTHPDRLITGGAYASYRTPPPGIERFSPNLAVFISNVGRPFLDEPQRWQEYWDLVEAWRARLAPGRILRVENNLYVGGQRPAAFPMLHPRAFARDLKALKGVSLGDWNEVPRLREPGHGDVRLAKPGLNHLNLYVNAALLWDADQDIEALLEEYYRLFYGPAAARMRTAFDDAEAAYPRERMNKRYLFGEIGFAERIRLLERLHEAREVAGDTVYGARIDLILGELQPLEEVRRMAAHAEARGDVPVFTGLRTIVGPGWEEAMNTLVLDGKVEEPFWMAHPYGARLRDARTGGRPEVPTSFYIRYYRDHIVFGVICREAPGRTPRVTTTQDGDPAILDGDHVEILLETDIHSYYRMVVNPAGALLDMDMQAEEGARERWRSNADVAAHIGEEFWSVEMRVPVVGAAEGGTDPLNFVVGTTPSHTWPWHFNVGRRIVEGGAINVSAFSPTGDETLLDPLKFGVYRPRL